MKFFNKLMSHSRSAIGCGLVVALLIFLTMAKAYASPLSMAQMSAKDFFKSGVENTLRGDLKQAVIDFTQAIALDSQMGAAYGNRCLVYLQLGDYQQATVDCTQALQLNPDIADRKAVALAKRDEVRLRELAYLNRGLAFYRQGRYQEAIADYDRTIQLKPSDYRAYYNRGLARFEQKDYQSAIADYNQALHQIQERDEKALATIYNDRGLARFQLKDISHAMLDFSQAIRLDAGDARAYYNRGCACHRQRDYQGAIRDFTLALQRQPDRGEAYVNRGIARYQLGYRQAAFEDLRKGAECFCDRGKMVAYQQTLNLIKKIQQHSPSEFESGVLS